MRWIVCVVVLLFLMPFSGYADQRKDILNDITITVLKEDYFEKALKQCNNPSKGQVYVALLVEIINHSDIDLYSNRMSVFKLVLMDGYVIEPATRYISDLRSSRIDWNAKIIPHGEKRKGWAIFSIPKNAVLDKLAFEVLKVIKPHQMAALGRKTVTF